MLHQIGDRLAGLVDDVKRLLGRHLRLLIRRSSGLLRSTETHPPEGDELLGSRRSLFREVFKKRLAIAHIVDHARFTCAEELVAGFDDDIIHMLQVGLHLFCRCLSLTRLQLK